MKERSLEGLLVYARARDLEEEVVYHNPGICAIAQYYKATRGREYKIDWGEAEWILSKGKPVRNWKEVVERLEAAIEKKRSKANV